MKTHNILEWYSAEELHKASQSWLVELEFIKDEHLFFEDLIKSFTLKIIDNIGLDENTYYIDALYASQKKNNLLIRVINKHDKNLKILIDGIDQPKEESLYKKEHTNLIIEVNEYLKEYKSLKTQLFRILKDVFKKDKQKRLTT